MKSYILLNALNISIIWLKGFASWKRLSYDFRLMLKTGN